MSASPLRHVPTALVLLALAGIGWWGHRTGWKAPSLSGAAGTSGAAPAEDWCPDHNVPASACIACNPERAGADPADWCREHGLPESQCTVCHPEILARGASDDGCAEHGVPESQCNLCHPEIAVKGAPPEDPDAAEVALDPAAPQKKNPRACRTHLLRVQFASAAAVRKAGVSLAAVEERPMAARLKANGAIDYDRTRFAVLSPLAPGAVRHVLRRAGEEVRRGDVLALIDAAAVGQAKAEFLQARALAAVQERAFARARDAAREGFGTEAAALEAEAALRAARIRLLNARQTLANLGLPVRDADLAEAADEDLAARLRVLGLPKTILEGTPPDAVTANLLPIVAPFDATVVSCAAVPGEIADPSRPLFAVADLRRMWVLLDVPQERAELLAPGQFVRFRPDGTADRAASGRITWIATEADPVTRTVKARAEVRNPGRRLRAGAYGEGVILLREVPAAVAVPEAAVQWEGCCNVVFVRETDTLFRTRKVRLGIRANGFAEVLAGVSPGEVVAAAGSAILKSDLLKSRLGAGCAGD
jgi:cobalt-zinc-cadmium efflux system membrane fusion protein